MMPACIFDMDGVLVDTEPLHIAAWQEFFARRDITLTDTDIAGIHGVRGHDIVRRFMPQVTLEEAHRLRDEKAELYMQKVEDGVPIVPGALAFVQALKERGVPVAVGTSAKRERATFQLDAAGFAPFVDVVVTAEDVTHGKPDPEIYLTAAARLGVPSESCVVFEDAFAGVEAGQRAGMKVVALLTSHTKEEFVGVFDTWKDFMHVDADTLVRAVTAS